MLFILKQVLTNAIIFQEINEADKEKFLNECKRCAQECTSSDNELFNRIKKLRTEFL